VSAYGQSGWNREGMDITYPGHDNCLQRNHLNTTHSNRNEWISEFRFNRNGMV